MPGLLEARTLLSQNPKLVKDRAVIFLFMHGGPSQFETFDPKMDAPSEIRSMTGEISTRLPGITFGSTFEKLAKLNDKFSIVRSFSTQSGSHDARPLVDPKYSSGAHVGSHYAHVAGTSHPQTGIPRNVILYPRAVKLLGPPPCPHHGILPLLYLCPPMELSPFCFRYVLAELFLSIDQNHKLPIALRMISDL